MVSDTAVAIRQVLAQQMSGLPSEDREIVEFFSGYLGRTYTPTDAPNGAEIMPPFYISRPLFADSREDAPQAAGDVPIFLNISLIDDQLYSESSEVTPPVDSRFDRLAGELNLKTLPVPESIEGRRDIAYSFPPDNASRHGLQDRYHAAVKDLKEISFYTNEPVTVLVPAPAIILQFGGFPVDNRRGHSDYKSFEQTVRHLGYLLKGHEATDPSNLDFSLLITYSTREGIKALLAGTSVIILDRLSPLAAVCPSSLACLGGGGEFLDTFKRDAILEKLAYRQWSLEELHNGTVISHFMPRILERSRWNIDRKRKSSAQSSNTVLNSPQKFANVGGRPLRVDLSRGVERDYYVWSRAGGGTDSIAMSLWALSYGVFPDDCVCIAGAGIGFTSLAAIAAGASEVIAFEPDQELARRLSNLSSDEIQAMPFALGRASGEARLLKHGTTGQSFLDHALGFQKVASSYEMSGRNDSSRFEEGSDSFKNVQVRRLDDLCQDFEFDVVYIDSNGSAFDILQGAKRIFDRRSPRIVIAAINGDEAEKVIPWLDGYYSQHGRVEAGREDWCRLLSPELADCGRSDPSFWVFFNEQVFPEEVWSLHATPRSVEWSPDQLVDTSTTIAVVPIGRFGPLSRPLTSEN